MYLSFLSLAIYILTKMSVNLYSGALFIKTSLHWDMAPAITLIIGLTAFCTVTGGLAAVIYTDTIQAFLMLVGGMILMTFSFVEVGGISNLYTKYMEAVPSDIPANSTCGIPRSDSLYLLRDPWDSDMPWLGFLLGQTAASIWYWCADQVIVQRALAAKNLAHAQGGTLFAGYLKLLPLFMMVMPGMVSRVLYADVIACATPEACIKACDNAAGCSNLAYPMLIMNLMPLGLRGLMVAVMLAALVTDLTSIFNSASSLFTMDIYPLIRKKPSNKELMIVGRFFVIVMTALSIAWIPVVENTQGGQLYIYIQAISAYLQPPIAAMFLVGILWKRANEQGAFWGLMAGIVTGGTRMILEFTYPEPKCGEEDLRPSVLAKVHYMYFAFLLFFQTVIVMIVVSLLTEPLEDWRIIRTVYSKRYTDTVRPDEIEEHENSPEKLIEELEMEQRKDGDFEMRDDEGDGKVEPLMSDEDLENPSCMQKFGAPSSRDHNGEPKVTRQLVKDWLKHIAAWFCGFSLSENTNSEADHNLHRAGSSTMQLISDGETLRKSLAEKVARRHVRKLVGLIRQKPRTRVILFVNLVIITAIATFITILFSLPPSFMGIPGND